jgi:hypothetical protein
VKKYLVLNNYFLSRIVPPKGIQLEAFYPLRYPTFEKEIQKAAGEIWISIIGGVENRRKDLAGCIPLMESLAHLPVRFVFLGKSDSNKEECKLFVDQLNNKGLRERVVLFDTFVAADVFDAYLRNTDLIWPMVHPKTPSAVEYFKNQISGALNVAFAYKIPLLVHRAYSKRWLDLGASVLYTRKDFRQQVSKAMEELDTYKQAQQKLTHLQPEFQEKTFLEFVLDR